MDNYVTLKNLAQELGLDRSNMRKYVLSKGIAPVKIRTPESRGQLTLALTQEEAETIRELRETEGFVGCGVPATNGAGFFYVIQVIPDVAPHRIKLGFASNVANRLQAHRTSAPTAEIVKCWSCTRSWEQAAIASATQTGCQLVGGEVFDCTDIEALVARCDAFFAIMPDCQ